MTASKPSALTALCHTVLCIATSSLIIQPLAAEEYRGKFTPDAEYVLSGQLAKDTGPLPPMPFDYLTDKQGFDSSRLTPVPEPGVHPRVLMSPQDIVRIREQVKLGDKADRYFRIIWNDVQDLAKKGDMLNMGLVALINEDEALGRKAAEALLKEAKFREPMVDLMNTHPGFAAIRDNWYYYARAEVKKVGGKFYRDAYASGGADEVSRLAKESVEFANDGDKHSSGYLFNTVLMNYDYLAPFMTEEERSLVRRVISKCVSNRYTAGMEVPGNMFINNHMSMGEDFILLALAIEGEEGAVDDRVLEGYAQAVCNKITYDVSKGGILHEKCKGFLPERGTIAVGRRLNKDLLRHEHLLKMVWAKIMDSNKVHERYAMPITTPLGEGFDEPRFWWMGRGSGPWMDQFFNWAFVVKHFYPEDEAVDYFYKSRLREMGLGAAGTDPSEKLPTPRIRYTHRDVMLMTATDGLRKEDGQVADYDRDGLPEVITSTNGTLADLNRGVGMARASWDPDALTVHYEARSDVYSAGHETPEAGDFNIYADGVEWSARNLWYLDCYFRNMVLIDGYSGIYSPVAADLMEVTDTAHGTTFISDNTDHYNYRKHEKMFYLWHPLIEQAPGFMGEYSRHGLVMDRSWELPFQPHMKEYQENKAGLDWGNWHGETRGPEMYSRWNDVDHVFRTVHLAKGAKPYVLVVDDVRKDDKPHQYDWCFTLAHDVVLASADSSVRGRHLDKGMPDDRSTDLILCIADTPEKRFNNYGGKMERQPKKGDPMLLVRTLWRNSTGPFPQPSFEQSYGPARIKIPAMAVDPEFRVMIFPFRYGDKLPVTSWNDDRSKLTVSVGGDVDVYEFGTTDRERTIFSVTRNEKASGEILAGPPTPELDTAIGWVADKNHPDELPVYLLNGSDSVNFRTPAMGNAIHYTLDGSEVTEKSPVAEGPVAIAASCTLKAKTFARYWPFNKDNGSETFEARIELRSPVAGSGEKGLGGLGCEAFEIHRTIFDEKTGIFTGKKYMMPDLDAAKPLLHCLTEGFSIPKFNPVMPGTEMAKAYYRFSGSITVAEDGIYSFRVNSNGPVKFIVGGQDLIDVVLPYGLAKQNRFGQASLKAGTHKLELVVCDPVFWKGEREKDYAIDVAMMSPGSANYQEIDSSSLRSSETGLKVVPAPRIPSSKAVEPEGAMVAGLVENRYDRSGGSRVIPPDGFGLEHFTPAENEKPYQTRPVLGFDSVPNAGRLVELTGYFIAQQNGRYTFRMSRVGGNRLFIGGHEILRNSIAAPALGGEIELDAGMHSIRALLSASPSSLEVRIPGAEDFVPVTPGALARSEDASASNDGRLVAHMEFEKKDGDLTPANNGEVKVQLRNAELVDGKIGKGAKFNGQPNSQILAEGLPSPEDALTIAAWIRVDKPTETTVLASSRFFNPGILLRGHKLQADYYRGSGVPTVDLRKFGADKGEWCHIAITFDAKVSIYVNGELQGWEPKTDGATTAHIRDVEMFTGLDGAVDDLKIFNKSLKPDEIKKLAK